MKLIIRAADRLGMAGAGLCLLHCLAVPLLIVLVPFFSWMDTGEETHQYLAAFAVLPVMAGLVPGYFLHRRPQVLAWGITGLVCIVAAAFIVGPRAGEAAELLTTIVGAAMLFVAHRRNTTYCRSCPA